MAPQNFFKILSLAYQRLCNNFPKFCLNCSFFGYNMCFDNTDWMSFLDFWFFNFGGNYGPQNFSNSIALKSEIGHKFLKYCQNCVIFGYNVAFHPIYQINLSGFWIFSFGGNYGAPHFSKCYHSLLLIFASNFLNTFRFDLFCFFIRVQTLLPYHNPQIIVFWRGGNWALIFFKISASTKYSHVWYQITAIYSRKLNMAL